MTAQTNQLEPIKNAFESISFNTNDITKTFKTTNAYTSLITPGADKTKEISPDSRERQFSTTRPIYIRQITFTGSKTKNIQIHIVTADGIKKKFITKENKPAISVGIWEFCTGFEIRSSSKLSRPSISSIQIHGLDTAAFPALKTEISEFYSAKYQLEKLLADAKLTLETCDQSLEESSQQLVETNENLDISRESLYRTELELSNHKESLELLTKKIALSQEKLNRLNSEEINLKNNCHQLETQNKTINQEIAEVSKELSRLVNDKSLISDEFKDYVTEGKAQSATYIKVMILPMTIIGLCAAFLFNGASDILFGHYETSQDKIAALALRIPFAAVLWGISYFCWDLAKKFLNKVFEVQSERLTLAKLLVIAKDTVFSTAEQANATQDEKLYLRTRLKIEMLKAHLSKDIGDKLNPPESPQKR